MLVIIGALLVGVVLTSIRKFVSWEMEFFVDLGQGIWYGAAVIMVLVASLNHAFVNAEIVQYEELKRTIEEARSNEVSEYERATLIEKIIETNKSIASNKYWNETIFDIFIPDAIANLEPLK